MAAKCAIGASAVCCYWRAGDLESAETFIDEIAPTPGTLRHALLSELDALRGTSVVNLVSEFKAQHTM